jgi:hypothetical protein
VKIGRPVPAAVLMNRIGKRSACPTTAFWFCFESAKSVDKQSFQIDNDITRAETLPADVYVDLAWYERAKEKIFARLCEIGTHHFHKLLARFLNDWLGLRILLHAEVRVSGGNGNSKPRLGRRG